MIQSDPKKTVAKMTEASSSPTTKTAVAVNGRKKIDNLYTRFELFNKANKPSGIKNKPISVIFILRFREFHVAFCSNLYDTDYAND